MLKLVLRVASTSLVVIGAVTLAHVATPAVDASVAVPPPGAGGATRLAASIAPFAVGSIANATASAAPPTVEVSGLANREAGSAVAQGPVGLITAGRVAPTLSVSAGPGRRRGAPSDQYSPADRAPGEAWSVPSWFIGNTDIHALVAMDGRGAASGPSSVRSRSVFVYDLDREEVLYARGADTVRPVASITKLISALAFVSASPDLDREVCIGAEQYPTRSGARSHLSTGDCITGWDALGAALVASDNRGAYALAAAAGMGVDSFIERMNQVSADLGLEQSSWADPSGLEDENLSTARDIARATVAVASHPLLAQVASAQMWDVHRSNKANPRRLYSTDRLGAREDLIVHTAKTGYTDTARYCFTTLVETRSGQRLVVTLLGAEGKLTRWADVDRVLRWADGNDDEDGVVAN